MGRRILIVAFLLLITTLRMLAQSSTSSFEFIENKGQWDHHVRFKGQIATGAFFLQNTGFQVVQRNTDDLKRIHDLGHGRGSSSGLSRSKPNTTSKPDFNPSDGSGSGNGSQSDWLVRSHAYNVVFLGANENPVILPEKALPTYNNYFIGSDSTKWATNVKLFQAVVYKNVYPNIDVRYYSENGNVKYDFIVRPGGDYKKIVMKVDGAEKVAIRNKELVIKTSVSEVRELSPYSYEFDSNKGRSQVECAYEISGGNIIRFNVKNFSGKGTLVIDPTLIFSSFTGSTADEYGFTATPGPDGSLYSGGRVEGTGYRVTPGAFQTNFGGGTPGGNGGGGLDIGITRFSPNGNIRIYGTYIGGNGNDFPHSLIADGQGNLVVLARTYSGESFPKTVPKIGPGGGADIGVVKLSAAGNALIGGIVIGGSGTDCVNIKDQFAGGSTGPEATHRFYGDDSRSEVILDGGNNIIVAAQTQSGDFPTTAGVFQPGFGGDQDGVVIKINPNCNAVTFASYLGGDGKDAAIVVAAHPSGTIYVAGGTTGNFPGNKTGTLGATYTGGDVDGFVSIISADGSALLRSTYIGTNNLDIIYGIQFDNKGFPYVQGITEGIWTVRNAAYSQPSSGQFIAKLQPDLSAYVYSTCFGTGRNQPNMSPVAFLVDRCENVYISGWGGWLEPNPRNGDPYRTLGVAGMPITNDAIKRVTDNRDFYFIVIKRDASGLLYGSFFGQDGGEGEHVDGGTSRFDKQGVIYQAICANCFGGSRVPLSAPYPITAGVIGPSNGALPDGCNLGAVKIAFNFAGVASGPKAFVGNSPDSTGCVPFTVTLRDTIRNAKSYEWDFGDGTPGQTTNSIELQHTFTAIGDYRVRLIAVDSSTCNIRDTAYITIKVRDNKADIAMQITKLQPCQALSYRFDNLSTPAAGIPFKNNSFAWDFGDGTRIPAAGTAPVTHNYANAGTYVVRLILVDTNYCNAPDSISDTLRVAPLVKAQFVLPMPACAPYNAVFNNTSLAGQQFRWDFGDGTTSTATNPVHLYPSVGTYTIKLVAIDSGTCNIIDSTTVTLTVNPKPTADFSHAPNPPEVNKPTIFTNLSIGGTRFKWLFGDGDSTVKTTMDTVNHQYNATGTYNACLIAYNQAGCTDTICKPVQAQIQPLLDVPNAFTPGRNGRNAVVRVEGFGISKMIWKIYNRWGQKVFESSTRTIGWDGTYNGQLQPMDVYAYTLDVEFTDGTRTRKTGDISLIR